MQVQVNSNNSVDVTAAKINWVSEEVNQTLDRFSDKITRVEVHLNDVNSEKGGGEDKSCSIEARLKGLKPLTVNHKANSFDLALNGALDKVEKLLGRTLDKLGSKKGRTPLGSEPLPEKSDNDELDQMDEFDSTT